MRARTLCGCLLLAGTLGAAPGLLLKADILSFGVGAGYTSGSPLPIDYRVTALEWAAGLRLNRQWAAGIEAVAFHVDALTVQFMEYEDFPRPAQMLGLFVLRAPSLLETPRATVVFGHVRCYSDVSRFGGGSIVELGLGVNKTFYLFRPELEIKAGYAWDAHERRFSVSLLAAVGLGGWWEFEVLRNRPEYQ